jgi:uncharacterized protein YbjT (DUF2867 family)
VRPPLAALLAGATGLVGRACLGLLGADPAYARVTALVRRPAGAGTHAARVVFTTVDFDRLDQHRELFAVDHVFCALGTTIRTAGSREAFRHVDFDYPLRIAQLALDSGARHFLLVSALGAGATGATFYSRTKGELEDAIGALGFRSFTIARPSMLLGRRAEFRLFEKIGIPLSFLLPPRYWPVHARQVALTLVAAAREDRPGRRLIENRELRGVAAADGRG